MTLFLWTKCFLDDITEFYFPDHCKYVYIDNNIKQSKWSAKRLTLIYGL